MSEQNHQSPREGPRTRGRQPGFGALTVSVVSTAALLIAFASARGGPDPDRIAAAADPFASAPTELVASPYPRTPYAPDSARAGAAAVAGAVRAAAPAPGPDRRPRFSFAAVRRGERVAVRERPGGEVVRRAGPRSQMGSRQVFGVTGRRGRWLRVTTPIATGNRDLWIEADRSRLRFGGTDLSIHASLSERVIELRRRGKVVRRFAVTVGAPGTATPTGRFAVTDTIVGGLNPVYGCCAVALSARQPNVPPGWTGGDRVAIHGTSGPVGNAASSGCLRATDRDVRALIAAVPLGTPVFIGA